MADARLLPGIVRKVVRPAAQQHATVAVRRAQPNRLPRLRNVAGWVTNSPRWYAGSMTVRGPDNPVEPGEVTQILSDIRAGRVASNQLLPLVYHELRRLAAARMANERAGHTLQPTALVHDAYVRLVGGENQAGWDSRAHFLAAASEAMRRILVENARRQKRLRHGGKQQRVTLNDRDAIAVLPVDHHDLLTLNDAFEALASESPDRAKLVELRYFAGLSEKEAAEILGISRATASRWWTFSKAWLLEWMNR